MPVSPQQQPIAVVGMACRLPGADDVDQFWEMLVEGRSAITRIPDERLDRRLYYNPQRGQAGVSYAEKAALIDYSRDATPDELISSQDLRDHDLAHVVLCRVAAESLRDARIDHTSLRGQRAGVYVGHATESGKAGRYSYGVHVAQTAELLRDVAEFQQLSPEVRDATIQALRDDVRSRMPWRTADCNPNLEACKAARLIASKFGFDGPQMVFNSACASSLQALAHAMKALSLGRVDMAVVGGASCFHSDTLVLFSQAQSLSTTGSFPFTQAADGLIVGEGYISFVLKRLADAVADENQILAVLPSVGIASDGHGKSLWAPRIEGQIEAIRRAYPDQDGIAGLDYIEAHATSTNLGDRTEIEAISRILREHLAPGEAIPIGGVKRNIGHTLEVAGAAGLLKVILAMRHGVIPPAVDGSHPLAPGIDWQNLPVFVNDRPIAWPKRAGQRKCRAAVNAFGIGGLNVHLVVESYEPRPLATNTPAVRPVAPSVSAATGSSSDIAIVGMGAVLPGARDVGAFRELLESARCAIGEFPPGNWDPRLFDNAQSADRSIPLPAAGAVVGFEYDWRKHRIPPKQLAQANPLQFMMLDAVDQAFQQSGLREHAGFDRVRTGCIVGTKFGGDFAAQLLMGLRIPDSRQIILEKLAHCGVSPQDAAAIVEGWRAKLLDRFPALIDESGSFTASALASRVTKSFDLMGGGIAVDAGDMGSFAALTSSVDMLLSGACDTMVCVAGEDSLLPETYQYAALAGRLASSMAHGCPFDAAANGSIPGVGAVALLLKRLEDAERDGLKVLGIIKGIGVASDNGRPISVKQAAERALADAGVRAADVSGVETIGSGVVSLDAEEVSGLAQSYALRTDLPLSTLVGRIGHLGSAAGLSSVVAALLALEHETLPAMGARFEPSSAIRQSKFRPSAAPQALTTTDPQGKLYVGLSGASNSTTSYHVILQRGKPVMPQPAQPALNSTSPWQTEKLPGGVLMFDATIRRRERLRRLSSEASQSGVAARPVAATPIAPVAAVRPLPSTTPIRSAASNGAAPPASAPAPAKAPAPPAIATPSRPTPPLPATPVSPPTAPAAATVSSPAASSLSQAEVESFLISFVMEQTGYPREIVDLDADLEADLGIDSIKKAQLFGELGEYFDVQASADLSLDAFPTLRTVMNFLLAATPGGATTSAQSAAPATPVAAPSPIVSSAVSAANSTLAPPAPTSPGLEASEVELFLINFVMEQTGYPREIVDLDADLESDLGIDSIKKAQLFGELGEYFDVQASADLSLDAFPTLRTVMNFLLAATPVGATPSQQPAAAAPQPTALSSTVSTTVSAVEVGSTPTSPGLEASEVETFLINFVMEQTGYPREIVDLDADLESDLGIDSIKKAQLFGELGEYFDVQASADLSLDAFPTLRTVMDFLLFNAASPPAAEGANSRAAVEGRDDVESFVIGFVMDQTGYPRQVIDLDGDFEIDLGIDSQKQADMLQRLSDYYPAPALFNQRFNTLRSVIDYIRLKTPAN